MDGLTTITVGAGVIGLSVARELALSAANDSNTKHTVIVIDIRDKPCTLASEACSGILAARKAPRELQSLFELASEGWLQILNDRSSAINFKDGENVRLISPGNGKSHQQSPSWFPSQREDTFSTADDTMGRIATTDFASYLFAECKRLGVTFILDSAVIAVWQANETSMAKVINLLDKSVQHLPFSNLVLAAGPWTTAIFKTLYPQNSIHLENHVRCIPWYRIIPPSPINSGDDIAFTHTSLAAESHELEPEITFTAHESSRTVSIAAIPQRIEVKDVHPNDAIDPVADLMTQHAILALKKAAGKRVPGGAQKLETSKFGYSYVSTATEGGLPVIDRVPVEKVGTTMTGTDDRAGQEQNGVWLCYGFGMFGTALAPGVGKVVTRKMRGVEVGVEEWVVGLKEASGW
ncbi:nucleotide-binding domain-containing protein [Teratosphaeria nubilosa]|uniref:Nucleotide-binding domain-containing protein n=1 Tax=Teratosphaeria nubilosa TaxID=161662 RepID=A0A6G1KV89_9PEZI|nr:nucleotide-binding domain-containing protein [Teratosphaeria nubilosa]